ncbi:hypothetical protein R1flu_022016 [Riccia fluitans]|uniref:HMA domain-containing protein n=1 Tax=Riccia fluitans TaxID=41844 RepID=A0ABD1ZR25_9MARC
MTETVVLKVGMSCEGCVGAVKRAIAKMDGVKSSDINLKEQKVTIVGNVKPDEVLERVSKTGKPTEFWPKDKE